MQLPQKCYWFINRISGVSKKVDLIGIAVVRKKLQFLEDGLIWKAPELCSKSQKVDGFSGKGRISGSLAL